MRNGILFLLLGSLFLCSCSEKTNPNPEQNTFDRQAMLKNYADQLIVPAFTQLVSDVDNLQQKLETVIENPTAERLTEAQNAWFTAYHSFLQTSCYNFGPAGGSGTRKTLTEEIGTFPASEEKINTILGSGNFNINDFNRDARGFLAIEYLLFDVDNNTEKILGRFSNPSTGIYLRELGKHLKSNVQPIEIEWKTSYQATFIANNGTDAGSSVSMFYNDFVKSYEFLKNYKVGLPLGKRAGQISTAPQLVEGYYSGKSIDFLKIQLRSIKEIWLGKSRSDQDGTGFKEYLDSVEGGKALVDLTLTELDKINSILAGLPETQRLSQQVDANFQQIEVLHTELQKHTRYFKSDMSSVLGIAITYSSGDGD